MVVMTEIIGDYHLDENTTHWVYTINGKLWDMLIRWFDEGNAVYLPTFNNAQVCDGDIVYVYVKGSQSGYEAMIQVLDGIKKSRKKLKVFGMDVGSMYITAETVTILQKSFKMKDVDKYMLDNPLYKSSRSYISKYTKGDKTFTYVPASLGRDLLNGLYDLADEYDHEQLEKEQEKKDKEKAKKEAEKKKLEQKKKKEKAKYKTKKVIVLKSDSDIIDTDTIDDEVSKDYEIITDSDYEDSDEDKEGREYVSFENEKEQLDSDNIRPMVPIMFYVCGNFRWTDECKGDDDFIKEFKKHYKRCSVCDKIDNNDIRFSGYIDKIDITTYEAYVSDAWFEDMLDAYYGSKEFILKKKPTEPYAVIYPIEEEDHLHNKSIIVEWCTAPAKFIKARIKRKESSDEESITPKMTKKKTVKGKKTGARKTVKTKKKTKKKIKRLAK